MKPQTSPAAVAAVPPTAWWPRGRNRWVLVLILAVAAYLRLSHMGLIPWNKDPAEATMIAVRMAAGQELPRHGLMFSVGVWQTPLEVYLMAPFMVFSQDPTWFPRCWAVLCVVAVFLTFRIGKRFFSENVGLAAAALFAVSPWPIMFSRQAWAQGIVHGMAVALLWAWCELLVGGRKPRHLFWVIWLTLAMAQIHVAAFSLIALFFILWWLFRFPLARKPIALAIGLHVLSVLPYLGFELETGWQDFKQAVTVMREFNTPQVYTVQGLHPQWGFPLPSHDHLTYVLNLSAGRQFEEFNGLDQPAYLKFGLMPLFQAGTALLELGLLVALLALGMYVVRAAKLAPRPPYVDLRADPLPVLLVLWMLWPVLFFRVTGMRSYVIYFSFVFPAPFLLVAWGFEESRRWLQQRSASAWAAFGRVAVQLALLLMVLGGLGSILSLYQFWELKGGVRGVRGEMYEHEVALTDQIVQAARSKTPIVATDWPPKTPVHPGLQYLVWWKLRDRALPQTSLPGEPQTAFVVVDRRFSAPEDPVPGDLARRPYKTFGPLRLYEIPLP